MKLYLVSLAVGILVGIIYAALGVRSPAPPLVALCGLFGMLLGEQVLPIGKRIVRGDSVTPAWLAKECAPKITGAPPPEAPAASQPSH